MSRDTKDLILKLLQKDVQKQYTIPDILKGIGIKNREQVAVALKELELKHVIKFWKKGRTKYYQAIA